MTNPCRINLMPILITLFCCAGLFLFFNLRLNELKITVEKQNRVLTSFITNVQQDIKAGGSVDHSEPTKHFAAPEALIAARKQEMDKIVVSDDEDDSESESDSDSESEIDSDEDVRVVDLKDINALRSMTFEPVTIEVLSFVNNESSIANESSITEIIEEPLNLESLNLVNTNDKQEETNKSEASYEQMKVDDLRKIVTDKNLSTKEEVKKLKKPELLVLLKK